MKSIFKKVMIKVDVFYTVNVVSVLIIIGGAIAVKLRSNVATHHSGAHSLCRDAGL